MSFKIPDPAHFRGRANRARGRRWELKCRKLFEEANFICQRLDETDFGYGRDLLLFREGVVGPLPVAIQCKCSQTLRMGWVGLQEALAGWRTAKFWVCLHAWRSQALNTTLLNIWYSDGKNTFQTTDFQVMIIALRAALFKDMTPP